MKKFLGLLFLSISALFIVSCSSNDDNNNKDQDKPVIENEETVIVFFPYTGNLYKYLSNNILDMEKGMLARENNPKVIVYINESKTRSNLYTIRKEGDVCVHDTLRTYTELDNTSVTELAELFSEIKTLAPASKKYSMIIGCHGMGWVYGDDYGKAKTLAPMMYSDDTEEDPITRWIGASSAKIDISNLAMAMDKASLHPHLMLFDVCYMANIESLFELRNTTDYIVASSIEVMGKGMPYDIVWDEINSSSTEALNSLCYKAYKHYNASTQPYCALSAIDCSKLDNLASVVKEINAAHVFPESERNSLQMLDGYRPSLFYDMGRYVELQCSDRDLMSRFDDAMSKAVMYKYNTAQFYTNLAQGARGTHDIYYCSGLTTSSPSVNDLAISGLNRTAWYKATH